MERINEITKRVSDNEQPKPVENLSDKILTNLWERFNHIYGHKFASAFGESAFDGKQLSETARTWSAGLRGVSGEQIAAGLRECIDRGDAWPPALPEFVAMCKGNTANGFGLNYTPECHRKENRRERLLESDENKAAHKVAHKAGMAGIKDIMKNGGKENDKEQ